MEHSLGGPVASFTDLLLDAVCMVDTSGHFVFVSAACEQIFGYTQREMIGMAMIDMVAPADRERTLAAARKVMTGQSHIHFENRYVRKDGTLVHLMWSARWSEADRLRVAVARDVTLLKQAESMQKALYAISEAAHASDDLAGLFERSHAIIGALLPASGFFVALPDGPDGQLRFACGLGRTPPDEAVAGRVLALCEDVYRGTAPSTPAGALLAVPLTSTDGPVGVLALWRGADGDGYGDADRDLLLFVSNQLAQAIQRKRLHAQLHFMALHDELTGLPNRRLFHDRLHAACARAQRQQSRLSLLFIDVNRFKQVNDRYGHVIGDRLLEQVATRLAACVRATDTVARLGGDEFVVLLEEIALPADAALVMDKIHLALAAPFDLGRGLLLPVSVSIGRADYPEHGAGMRALLDHADASMYVAKSTVAMAAAVAAS